MRYRVGNEKITDIHLSFSCQQDWQAMQPSKQHKICAHCSSCVYDFTDITSGELREISNNSSDLICGKFKKSQLSEIFLKYAATTFVAAASLTVPASGQGIISADSVYQDTEPLEEEEFIGIIVEKQAIPKVAMKSL